MARERKRKPRLTLSELLLGMEVAPYLPGSKRRCEPMRPLSECRLPGCKIMTRYRWGYCCNDHFMSRQVVLLSAPVHGRKKLSRAKRKAQRKAGQ